MLPMRFVCSYICMKITVVTSGVCLLIHMSCGSQVLHMSVNHSFYLWVFCWYTWLWISVATFGFFLVDTHVCDSQLLPLGFVCWYTCLWLSVVTSGVYLFIHMAVTLSFYLWCLFVETHICGSQLLPPGFVCWYTIMSVDLNCYTCLWIIAFTSRVCLLIHMSVDLRCYLWGLFDTHVCRLWLLYLGFLCWYTCLYITFVTSGVCLLIHMSVDYSCYLWVLFVDTHVCGLQLLPLGFVCWYTWLWLSVVTSGVFK